MAVEGSLRGGQNAPQRRKENLALVFQEVLTAIVRLRSNSYSVNDAEAFRAQIRAALKAAEQEAVQRGYLAEDVRLATFAVVAFLDESILNSRNPVFADWARKPLQEELFGVHVAGEIFFRNVERLVARQDSEELADVLEVHQLCLLLGFRGRYSMTGAADLRTAVDSVGQKIRRIRGHSSEISPHWQPPAEPPRLAMDPWLRPLLWGALGCGLLALLLFVAFKLSLGSGVSEMQTIAGQVRL